MKTKLFSYWEGHKPDYIKLCEQVLANKISNDIEYHIVSDSNINEYFSHKELADNLNNIKCFAHKGDYIRCCLIYKYGGIWMDSDQILVSNLSEVLDLLKTNDYVTYEWEKNQPSIGFFAANSGNILLQKWKLSMETLMSTKSEFHWVELGYDILHPILQDLLVNGKLKYYAYDARTSFAPLEWTQHDKFFQDCELETSHLKSVMLYNSKFPDWFKIMSSNDILNSNFMISKILRKNL
jgi:GH43 family beta-xylosidase